MRLLAVLLCALSVSAVLAAAKKATSPGDSSVGLTSYDTSKWEVVSGPDPTKDPKPAVKSKRVQDMLENYELPPIIPSKAFSNTSAITDSLTRAFPASGRVTGACWGLVPAINQCNVHAQLIICYACFGVAREPPALGLQALPVPEGAKPPMPGHRTRPARA